MSVYTMRAQCVYVYIMFQFHMMKDYTPKIRKKKLVLLHERVFDKRKIHIFLFLFLLKGFP